MDRLPYYDEYIAVPNNYTHPAQTLGQISGGNYTPQETIIGTISGQSAQTASEILKSASKNLRLQARF